MMLSNISPLSDDQLLLRTTEHISFQPQVENQVSLLGLRRIQSSQWSDELTFFPILSTMMRNIADYISQIFWSH